MKEIFEFNDKNNRRKLVFDVWIDSDFTDLESQLNSEIVNGDGDLVVTFHLDKYDKKTIKKLEDLSKRIPKNLDASFTIVNRGSKMRCSDLEYFIDLEESLKKENHALYFNGGIDDYELSEVIGAQEQIESFSKKINALDASPFEKYLIIYDFLTSKVYNESNKSISKSRDIISVLNGNNIVCVGYAQMLERLCKEAGIDCYMQQCTVVSKLDKDDVEGHANNIVRLKDEKYGIDGLFYADACWDAVEKGKEHKKTYMYALLPLSDKDKMKYAKVQVGNNAMYGDCPVGVECDQMLLSDLGRFGIDTNTREVVDNKSYLDFKKRRRALERVEKLFKANNIPADIYMYDNASSEICKLNRFVALCMEDKIDEARLNESIEALKKVINSTRDKQSEFSYMLKDFVDEKDKDVYKYIEKLKSSENKVESTQYQWNDGYTFDEVVEIIKTEGPEVARQKTGIKKVAIKIKPELPYEFRGVKESHEGILMGRRISAEVEAFKGNGQAISLVTLEKGLRRSYELRGMSPEKVEYEVGRALKDTIERARDKFDKSASNCFSSEVGRYLYSER